jgi:hypothetical protein
MAASFDRLACSDPHHQADRGREVEEGAERVSAQVTSSSEVGSLRHAEKAEEQH